MGTVKHSKCDCGASALGHLPGSSAHSSWCSSMSGQAACDSWSQQQQLSAQVDVAHDLILAARRGNDLLKIIQLDDVQRALPYMKAMHMERLSATDDEWRAISHIICSKCASLDELSCKYCRIGESVLAVMIAALCTVRSHLTSLDLRWNGIGAAGAQAIAASQSLSHLTSLDLGDNDIGDAGAQAIAASQSLSNLTSLYLSWNGIGAAGAQAIAASQSLSHLTSLDLSWNNIGDAGAQAIAASQSLSKLISLDLSWNRIGAEGAQAIAASQSLSKLISLDLSLNSIGAAGAKALSTLRNMGVAVNY